MKSFLKLFLRNLAALVHKLVTYWPHVIWLLYLVISEFVNWIELQDRIDIFWIDHTQQPCDVMLIHFDFKDHFKNWSTNCSTNMSNLQIAVQMCQIYKLPNEMKSVQLCHGDFLTTKIPKIMALHLAATKNSKLLWFYYFSDKKNLIVNKILQFTTKSSQMKWCQSILNSTLHDCCVLTSVNINKKSCQMRWSQSIFNLGIFLVRKSPCQSWNDPISFGNL